MHEIRFHGRGGQDAVIGSEVRAHAFFIEDKFVQAFPSFGAPVTALCRVDATLIHLRNQMYAPDHPVILGVSLLTTGSVTQGLKKNGTIVVNAKKPPQAYRDLLGTQFRVFVVDAAGIAVAHRLGSPSNPIVNTAILGAFARATGLVGIAAVEEAIAKTVPAKKEENRRAAQSTVLPLYEVEKGRWRINVVPEPLIPVIEYLESQGRFRQMPQAMADDMQADVDRRWEDLMVAAGL